MPMLDIFDDDAFSLMSLTAAINKVPEVPTIIGDLGVFEESGVASLHVAVEEHDLSLTLVEPSPRGSPGETEGTDLRKMRDFRIAHFQRDDAVMADEVQGIRSFGTENMLETVQQRVNEKLARHARAFDFTLEHLRLGAIKGIVLDKNGNTLLNLFTAFGIAQPDEINFALTTATTDVRGKCQTVLDAVDDALEGFMVSRVVGLCGDDFFHSLVTHTKVEDTYKNWEAAVALRGDPRLPFEFGGITWRRYHTRPKAKAANSAAALILTNECKFIPVGVPELFITRYGPADYEETVNTIGLPRYAKQWARPDGKGRHLQMQTNPLCMCTQPAALQRAKRA